MCTPGDIVAGHRMTLLLFCMAGLVFITSFADADEVPNLKREIVPGLHATRPVYGAPYDLAENRLVFTNWYYVQPGDLDWREPSGNSVYVDGDSDLFEAQYVGINAPHGIRILAEKPQVRGPLSRPYRMILQDGEVFKGWTSSEYFESEDGVNWEMKAPLKLDERIHDGLFQIFIDATAPAAERYKAVWVGILTRAEFDDFRARRPKAWEPHATFLFEEKGVVSCLRGSVSPDGIRWTTLPDPLVVEYCDTWNTTYYDPTLREYVIYTRYWSVGPYSEVLPTDLRSSWTRYGRRAIGRTASRNFSRFAPSELILEPSPAMLPSEQIYTNCRTSIPGAPDHHLMFPTIWNASRDDTTRITFASSHDGKNWHWVPGGNLLGTPSFGRWNGGCIWATPDLIELPDGDWALPYLAHNVPHKYPRGIRTGNTGYAVWPKGRLVGLQADDEGEFTLIPIVSPGTVLRINAVTKRAGWIKIEVVGKEGRTLENCVPVVGDQMWTPVKWNDHDDLGVATGEPLVLRVQLKQAKIYGFEFQ